jgi:hypothetical protein
MSTTTTITIPSFTITVTTTNDETPEEVTSPEQESPGAALKSFVRDFGGLLSSVVGGKEQEAPAAPEPVVEGFHLVVLDLPCRSWQLEGHLLRSWWHRLLITEIGDLIHGRVAK